jgi:anti-sigma B factor antagonist
MVIEFQVAGEICFIRIKGRFATGQDPAYLREKTEEIKNLGCLKVLADFKEVPFIDSTGIGFLIAVYTSIVRNEHGTFVLANANPHVLEILTLTKLSNVFSIFPDETSALEALNRPPNATAQQAS